ncbi:YhcN/YlaJ family sporulation lipoprotein [Bacillaceae bacterium S4-13-58]
MIKKRTLGTVTISALLLASGCAGNNDESMIDRADDNRYQTEDVRYNTGDNRMNVGDYPRNRNYDNGNTTRLNTGNDLNNNQRDIGDNVTRNNNENRFDIADEVAENVSREVSGVDRAYVLTTDDNAYVAVVLDEGTNNELGDNVKQEIERAVKDVDADIDNIYISANPDFVNMTDDYTNDVRQGEPVEGFFREFTQMIDRVFPDVE